VLSFLVGLAFSARFWLHHDRVDSHLTRHLELGLVYCT